MHRVPATIALVLLIAASSLAADLPTLAAAYANPTLGPATTVQKLPIRISNLTVELTAGSAAPVLGGTDPIGIFFSGNGRFTYRSTDRIESSLVIFEAKKLGREATKGQDGTVTVSGDFSTLYLLAAGIDLPRLDEGKPDPKLQDRFNAHREHFARALDAAIASDDSPTSRYDGGAGGCRGIRRPRRQRLCPRLDRGERRAIVGADHSLGDLQHRGPPACDVPLGHRGTACRPQTGGLPPAAIPA